MARRKSLPAGISRRSDGKLQSRFTINGKRYTVYGDTVKECKEKETERRQEVAAGIYEPGKKLTFKVYSERWLTSKIGTVKPASIYARKGHLQTVNGMVINSGGTRFGDLRLVKIDPQNVRDLQKALVEKHNTNTTNSYISLVREVLNAAMYDRIIFWNPAQGVRQLKRTEEQARDTIHRALTMEETTAFLNAASEMHSWYYNLYVLLLHTGLRIGEAGALVVGDVNSNGIMVRRTLTRGEDYRRSVGKDTKTAAGTRFVPLDPEARRAIRDQRKIESMVRPSDILSMTDLIFKTQKGRILLAQTINNDIARICKAAGVQRFSVHAFRDTFITRCVESGMEPKELQEIAGHSNISMTLGLYAHSNNQRKITALNAVNFV